MTADKMTKLRVKVGDLTVSYEGSEALLEGGLVSLVREICSIAPQIASEAASQKSVGDSPSIAMSSTGMASAVDASIQDIGTINNVAAKLDCKTGPDLIVAAAAVLTFGPEKQPRFDRKTLADEIKKSSYYRSTYSRNLTSYLKSLVKNKKLNEIRTGIYQLSPSIQETILSTLRGP